MAERDGAAIGVDVLGIGDAEFAQDGEPWRRRPR
jgi:hypothetical protein